MKNAIWSAGTGEYVIMVQDVTSPPFLGVVLQPAALCVTVLNPAAKQQPPTQRKSTKHQQRTSRNSQS